MRVIKYFILLFSSICLISSPFFDTTFDDSVFMLNYVNSKKIKFESYNSYIIESCENKMILDVFTKYDENNTLNGIIIKACTKEQIYQMCFSLYYQILKNFKIFMNIPFLEFYRRFRILLRLNFINIIENYKIIEISEDEYEKEYFVVITKR